ncbi:MAG: GNAT family N-acetyltransferase [Sulfitobacter sp.]
MRLARAGAAAIRGAGHGGASSVCATRAAWGGGIGRALMHAAQAYARGLGCRYLTVGTHVDNTAAQAMYRAIGFDRLDREGPRFRVKW